MERTTKGGRGSPPPELTQAVRALIDVHGANKLGSMTGLSTNALVRVAAALPVNAGTIFQLQDYLRGST